MYVQVKYVHSKNGLGKICNWNIMYMVKQGNGKNVQGNLGTQQKSPKENQNNARKVFSTPVK